MKQIYVVMGQFGFVGICEAPHDAVMAHCLPQFGGLGSVAPIFRRNGGRQARRWLLFERASNRPHDRARDSSLVGVLNRCLNLAIVVVEISPKGVSLAWGPFSGPEADDWRATANSPDPIGRL
jgi:hypothetical protein